MGITGHDEFFEFLFHLFRQNPAPSDPHSSNTLARSLKLDAKRKCLASALLALEI